MERVQGVPPAAAAERYGLFWPGKAAAGKLAHAPVSARLVSMPGQSRHPRRTRNLVIEGDNLDALKLLQQEYAGRVKMICIDPPYNTGRPMLYHDDFRLSARSYHRLCGAAEEKPTTSANASFGRTHVAWLSMMYPRLILARRLLSDNGLLFVCIDDREAPTLRLLLDEVFGEDRHLATFVWRRRSGALDAKSGVSVDHEYVICYGKPAARLAGVPRTFRGYANPDADPRGPWIADNLSAAKPGGDVWYPIVDPATGAEYWPPAGRYWPYNRHTMQRKIAEGRILFPRRPGGAPMLKRFQAEARNTHRPVSTLMEATSRETGEAATLVSSSTTAATRELKRLFGDKVFLYAKPVPLLRSLLTQGAAEPDALVLDFFAGSGATGQAVLELNVSDGGQRRFILVQQAEPLPPHSAAHKLGIRDVAALARERLRRVMQQLDIKRTRRGTATARPVDLGFRAVRIVL